MTGKQSYTGIYSDGNVGNLASLQSKINNYGSDGPFNKTKSYIRHE